MFDPRDDREKALGEVVTRLAHRPTLTPLRRIDPIDGRALDGMHDIDCAMALDDEIVPIEVKLGATRMRPSEFRERFVSNVPRRRGRHIDGNMIALLDSNGRTPAGFDAALLLRASGVAVSSGWLLAVVEQTLGGWRKHGGLARTLGTTQLVGVLAIESVARAVGRERAREIAKAIACSEIDAWPL